MTSISFSQVFNLYPFISGNSLAKTRFRVRVVINIEDMWIPDHCFAYAIGENNIHVVCVLIHYLITLSGDIQLLIILKDISGELWALLSIR